MFSLPVERNILLAEYTTFKIGGPANYFFIAKTEQDLQKILQEAKNNQIPIFILGNGSDILVSDQGFKGLVIKIEIDSIVGENNLLTVGAGVKTGSLLNACKDNGLSGLEFLIGIPATVGGLLWANAGSVDESICQKVTTIKVINEDDEIEILNAADCNFSYRDSVFKHKNYIIIEATFELELKTTQEVTEKIKTYIDKKTQSQPLNKPSIGSIFKNPENGKKAWELIEEVGLRGFQLGGAQISEKHANFIINTGQATASDVIMLISLIKQKVRDNLAVQLMEEVQYVGF